MNHPTAVAERQAEHADRIARARAIETLLLRLAWVTLGTGVMLLIVVLVEWSAGHTDTYDALVLLAGTVLATITSAATLYATGTNVGLGAARLELALHADE